MVGNRTAETEKHSILKHLIASILERMGHKVHIEGILGSKGIGDVFDKTTGYIYEVQTKKQKEIESNKVRNYLLYCGVKDIIFIYADDYSFLNVLDLYKELERKCV